jgi:hypothetical protein
MRNNFQGRTDEKNGGEEAEAEEEEEEEAEEV